MLQNKYKPEHLDKDFGKQIDSLIKIKQSAKFNLITSSTELLQMGVKIFNGDKLSTLPGLNIESYQKCAMQEFVWEAEFDDGSIVKQFQGEAQHHFGHIDQSKLKVFRWVSLFDCETENADKRAIVELDFKTGKFVFLNGFVPQEVRAGVDDIYPENEAPKLIMKMVKRESNVVNYPEGSISEVMKYNRYLIGWETKSKKTLLCVEPNGFVHYWHGETISN